MVSTSAVQGGAAPETDPRVPVPGEKKVVSHYGVKDSEFCPWAVLAAT